MLRCSILYSWWDVAHIRRGIMLAFVCCLLPPPVSPGGGTAGGSGLLRRSWLGLYLLECFMCVFMYKHICVSARIENCYYYYYFLREAERFLTISDGISLPCGLTDCVSLY